MLIFELERTPEDARVPGPQKVSFRSTTGRVEIRRSDLTNLVGVARLAEFPDTVLELEFLRGDVRVKVGQGEPCAAFAEMFVGGKWGRVPIPQGTVEGDETTLAAQGVIEWSGLRLSFTIRYE